MIFMIFLFHYLVTLHGDALPTPAVDVSVLDGFVNISPSCGALGSCRELSSIIQSCVATIFACIWFAQHPNVPPPSWSRLHKLGYAAMDTFIILTVPDIMLARAIQEFISAGTVRDKLNAISDKIEPKKKTVTWHTPPAVVVESNDDMKMGEGDGGSEEDDTNTLLSVPLKHGVKNPQGPAGSQKKPKGPRIYTRQEGFFIAMGGLHFYDDDDEPIRTVTIEDITDLAKRDVFSIPIPRKDDINDKSKKSWISKGLAIMQTVSFATQCVARLAVRLPITELELTALAYTMVTVLAYFIWWMKPVNVRRPVRVLQEFPIIKGEDPESIIQYVASALSTLTTKREFAKLSARLLLIAATAVLGSAFGAIHCIYWWTKSTYWHDQDIWYNYVGFLITALPVGMGACLTLLNLISIKYSRTHMVARALGWLLIGVVLAQMLLYEAARFQLLFLALNAFNHTQDPAVYQVLVWSRYMPHI